MSPKPVAETWIVTHRLAGASRRADKLERLHKHLTKLTRNSQIEDDSLRQDKSLRRVVRLRGDTAWFREQQRQAAADVILEPRLEFWPHGSLVGGGRPFARLKRSAHPQRDMQVTVRGDSEPLEAAEVTMLVRPAKGQPHLLAPQPTNASGQATLHYDSDSTPLAVAAYPVAGYWSIVQRQPAHPVELDCPPLPRTGPVAWWHRVMGIDSFVESAGAGIRIGLVGTGVSRHPCLAHVERIDDKDDLHAHGTHVCGIIAARPVEPDQFAGLAPASAVFSIRVFENDADGNVQAPDQGTLMHALERMTIDENGPQVDIVNMSLGGDHSLGLKDAVRHALEQGTVCVCSAGNSGQSVEYPAALADTIGVAALADSNWGPENSTARYMTPDSSAAPERYASDGLALANFSCFGAQLSCAAPGDGIISTVPPRPGAPAPFGVMDGTSLASPAACALLANLLSASAEYRKMPRGADRGSFALELFQRHCIDLGLQKRFQGDGLPHL